MSRPFFHANCLMPSLLLMLMLLPNLSSAQTRSDSIAILQLIAARALKDAQLQDTGITSLTIAPRSQFSESEGSQSGKRLLELLADGAVAHRVGTPVCPWHIGGTQQPGMELVVRDPQILNSSATAQVVLGCAGGLMGGRAFRWWFTYTLNRQGEKWVITEVRERLIT